MPEQASPKPDATECLIESLHAIRKKRSLVINPDYLDDEKLPEDERAAVLGPRATQNPQLLASDSTNGPVLHLFHVMPE